MAQKSLSVLHRIDSSMTWDTRIFNKKLKWFSYNLWFFYTYYYKNIFFIEQSDVYIYNNLHNKDINYIFFKKKLVYPLNYKKRFSYYISLYIYEFFSSLILLSIFFQINLTELKHKNMYIVDNKITTITPFF